MRMEKGREQWTLELGACPEKKGVRFKVWAPGSSQLSLHIPRDHREITMDPDDEGYFSARVAGLGPGTRYFYLLDGKRRRPDPVSRFQPRGVHGPSEVIDPSAFPWEDQSWKGLALEEMILYEIHTGTFTPRGTFPALIPHLDYLRQELGITAIELMPVAQFPGRRNWGYDGTYLYAPHNSYGGPFGLKTLINACHQKGLGVLLDVVYNHVGPEGNYLAEFGPYFTDRYKTPWGAAFNLDGPHSDQVRRFIIDNALYWVTEYHVDGLRIDAIQGIIDFSPRHVLEELRSAVKGQAENLGRTVTLIAESDLNDVRVLNPPCRGGYGLDAQWNDDFHHSLHTLLTGERQGYYKDFGPVTYLAKAIREGFVYSGQFSPCRHRRHGTPSDHLQPTKFIVFSQNHDQVANQGERLSSLVSLEALKVAAGVVLLSPNIPLLFMGEEYGEEAPFCYFIHFSDPILAEAVQRGRKEECSISGDHEQVDPREKTAFVCSRIRLDLRRQGVHKILFEYYQTLIRLRKEIPALAHLNPGDREVRTWPEKSVIALLRSYQEEQTVCFMNFQKKSQEIRTPLRAGVWNRVLNSSSTRWQGPGDSTPESITSDGSEVFWELSPLSLLLYRNSGV